MKAGRAEEVLEDATALVERNRSAFGEDQVATAQSRALRAAALARTGQEDEALSEFQASFRVLLDQSDVARVGGAVLARHRLVALIEEYLALLRRTPGAGPRTTHG